MFVKCLCDGDCPSHKLVRDAIVEMSESVAKPLIAEGKVEPCDPETASRPRPKTADKPRRTRKVVDE